MPEQHIANIAELKALLKESSGRPRYVYVLRAPDGEARHGGVGTPFCVGIGQDARLFAHEDEAPDPSRSGARVEVIRAIWARGGSVVRTIDSVHASEPWDREEALINAIGRLADGSGPLTNAQVYSPSRKLNGVELRKYAADHAASGDANAIPDKFKLRTTRLMAGPSAPRSDKSVFGKIHSVADANPSITGEALIALLLAVDFTANKSAYTQGGQVSASWLAGYVEGAFFRSDRRHLQSYRDE